MKTKLSAILLLMLPFSYTFGQTEKIVTLKTTTGNLEGTLMLPAPNNPKTVALIIAGSGPTDRDGNNPSMNNNSLKMLANELNKNGIASLRYDKRAIGKSRDAGLKESGLRFEHYINDAIDWINYLNKEQKFNRVIVIGHSEGSLIGMIASGDKNVSKFVSIAGIGQPADKMLREQLKGQPPSMILQINPILDALVKGRTVENVPQTLAALFRPSVQPYMISWFRYDPRKEIAKLKIPVMIIQGTTDIQVGLDESDRLLKALPAAKLVVIEGMNHIMKQAPADRQMNIQTYSQPELPLKKELISNLIPFILGK
jgi:pimeloyl-ACP methyl ester carboxylesterase